MKLALASGGQRGRWPVLLFFLAPAVVIYSVFSIYPLISTIIISGYAKTADGTLVYAGIGNFVTLFTDPAWAGPFWNALKNNVIFFAIHMAVQNPVGIALAALLSLPHLKFRRTYLTLLFVPTMLSVVIVGFVWQLILSPLWGVTSGMLKAVGLRHWFAPWLGQEDTALVTISLISVWQFVGIPMLLVYAALLTIPDDLTEAASVDGASGWRTFWHIRLPLVMPTVGLVSILTFVANFNAFDLIYTVKGALAGPDFSTDILGTLFYRTFFGYQLSTGNVPMGATVATVMFAIILFGVMLYLAVVQLTRWRDMRLSGPGQ